MDNDKITPVIMEPWPSVEENIILSSIKAARHAMTLDTLCKLSTLDFFNVPIVCADESLLRDAASCVEILAESAEYSDEHAGKCLARLAKKYKFDKAMFFSGGSCFFLSYDELLFIYERLKKGRFISNNLYSSDFVCFNVSDAAYYLDFFPSKDNGFSHCLSKYCGLEACIMPFSLGTVFDADSPADFAIMAKYIDWDCYFKKFFQKSIFCSIDVDGILQRLIENDGELFLYGRINPCAAAFVDKLFKCRKRFVSEERGLKSKGCASYTVLGSLRDKYVFDAFWHNFEKVFSCGIFDTRVIFSLFAGSGRFDEIYFSDLLLWKNIEEPFIREFTYRACASDNPVLFGGHSLVNGGIMALSEIIRRNNFDDPDNLSGMQGQRSGKMSGLSKHGKR